LLHLAGQVDRDALLRGVDRQRVIDLGEVPLLELGIEGRADHLGDPSGRGLGRGGHEYRFLGGSIGRQVSYGQRSPPIRCFSWSPPGGIRVHPKTVWIAASARKKPTSGSGGLETLIVSQPR